MIPTHAIVARLCERSPPPSLALHRCLNSETRTEISSFNENEEFEIRGPPGPLRRACPPRIPASEETERALTAESTRGDTPGPKTGAESARTATPHAGTVGAGMLAVVPRLEREKIRSGARTRGSRRPRMRGPLLSRYHTSMVLSRRPRTRHGFKIARTEAATPRSRSLSSSRF